jgi:hypothetical protein
MTVTPLPSFSLYPPNVSSVLLKFSYALLPTVAAFGHPVYLILYPILLRLTGGSPNHNCTGVIFIPCSQILDVLGIKVCWVGSVIYTQ